MLVKHKVGFFDSIKCSLSRLKEEQKKNKIKNHS